MRAVIAAEPLGGFPSWRQRWGGGGGQSRDKSV
jgi:hypothetical protein